MIRDELIRWIYKTLEPFPIYHFEEKDFKKLVETISNRNVAEDYEKAFITLKEAEGMILHEAYQILKTIPHSRSSPKPPEPPR